MLSKLTINTYLKKIYFFLEKYLFSICLYLILFNASKTFLSPSFTTRGILNDYIASIFFLNYFFIILLCLIFLNQLKLSDYKTIGLIILMFAVNIVFAKYKLVSFIYFYKSIFYILLIFVLVRVQPKIIYRHIFIINLVYLTVFLAQFLSKSSIFTYFPFGFYSYDGLYYHMDYSNIFGAKIVTPLGNFPHPNLFAAFLSFLNIFNLKKRNKVLFFLNFLVIFVLGSFSALLFNTAIYLLTYKQKLSLRKFLVVSLFALVLVIFMMYQFKPISITDRIEQLQISWFLLKSHLLTGLGSGNYIFSITIFEEFKKRIYNLQPIHNIFILFLVEYGLLGVVLVFSLIKKYRKFIFYTPFLFFILLFGLFDHFLITLNQGMLMASLTIYAHKSIINSNV